ncbi:hypothetical protein ACQ5SO_06885 [Rhodovulum sp. DZ06]|uniref:hypothetical protein n=1 Tax=Rhodovulum sp. DZ06 TaxID=3425126 RepID=UPI003D32628D
MINVLRIAALASCVAAAALIAGSDTFRQPEPKAVPAAADRSPALPEMPVRAAMALAQAPVGSGAPLGARIARARAWDAALPGAWTSAALAAPLPRPATPEAEACTHRTPTRAAGSGVVFHDCAARPSALPIRR